MFGDEYDEAFTEFKRIWDPANRMNTGKVIDLDAPAYGITENLRIGPDYNPPEPKTHFSYTRPSQFRPSRAAMRRRRCVSPRRRRHDVSFVYGHARGKGLHARPGAHALRNDDGEVINDGWKSEEVKDALDLAFRVKGAKAIVQLTWTWRPIKPNS